MSVPVADGVGSRETPVVLLHQGRQEGRGGGAEEPDAKLPYFSQRRVFGEAYRLLVPTQDFEKFRCSATAVK